MMLFDRLGVAASFVMQMAGGATLGAIAGQIANGGEGIDPALLTAYGAIGALFSLYVWSTKGRTERCEKREDTMLVSDGEKTATLRELASAVNKAADVTSSAVLAAKDAVEESRRNGAKHDQALLKLEALQQVVNSLMQTLDRQSNSTNTRGRQS